MEGVGEVVAAVFTSGAMPRVRPKAKKRLLQVICMLYVCLSVESMVVLWVGVTLSEEERGGQKWRLYTFWKLQYLGEPNFRREKSHIHAFVSNVTGLAPRCGSLAWRVRENMRKLIKRIQWLSFWMKSFLQTGPDLQNLAGIRAVFYEGKNRQKFV